MLLCRQQDFSPGLLLIIGRPKAETADEKSLDRTVTFLGFEDLYWLNVLRSRFITKLQDKGKIKQVQAETRITLQQIPVPLETDKPVHDKQMAAICLP